MFNHKLILFCGYCLVNWLRIFFFMLLFYFRNGVLYWIVNTVALIILIVFIPITWFKKLWILFSPINEDEPNRITPPKSKFCRYLYDTSKSIMSNGVARIIIYITSILMLTLSALIHLVGDMA